MRLVDLCYSCRMLPAVSGRKYEDMTDGSRRFWNSMDGKTVEETFTALYSNPLTWVECGLDVGVVLMLINSIVMGDGCTTCGEKILNWGRELGLGG